MNDKKILYVFGPGRLEKIRNEKIPLQIKNFFNRKTRWCASSTHRGEEEFCIDAHCNLKKKYKN